MSTDRRSGVIVGIVSAFAALMIGPAGARGDLLRDVGSQVDNLTQGLAGGGGGTPAPAPAPPTSSTQAAPAAAPAAPAATGEGTVATVDVVPDSNESDADAEEDVVVGRSHGEHDRGEHRGLVTILRIGLLDLEISVPSGEGESAHGPLEPIQAGLLDPICEGSQGMLCAEILRANSSSSGSGSENAFSVTDLHLGGEDGVDVDVAESNGSVTSDENCRSAHGDSTVARIEIGGEQVANLFPSSSDSRSCRGEGARSDEETALGVAGIASAGSSRTGSTPPESQEPETGGNAAGQGTVAALDVVPDLDDGDANPEEDVVVGRSRGENADGEHAGEVTVLSVGPLDLSIGSLSEEGESANGPLEGVQSGLLDAICEATEGNLCLEVLRADSEAGESGSSGSFAVATAVLGGPEGLGVIVGESNGSESEDEHCRRAHADATVAEVDAAGDPLVILFQSSADASACDGSEAETERDSTDAEVAGTGVPLPVDGCDDGTPNSTLSLGIADVTCNADTGSGDAGSGDGTTGGVRDSVAADVLPDPGSGEAAGDADGASSGATVDTNSKDGDDDGADGDDGDDGGDGGAEDDDGSGGDDGDDADDGGVLGIDGSGGNDPSLGPGTGGDGTGSAGNDDGPGGNLPFTGFDVFAALILAGLLLATGSVMRTIARDFGASARS